MQTLQFNGHKLFIKRDDLLNHHFSGNKARKLGYFLDNEFTGIKKIVGYGSVQANSLYSLAALANMKGWQLDFYVQRIADWIKAKPTGNYAGALKLGANIIEVQELSTNLDDYMSQKSQKLNADTLFVPEGGRCRLARHGIKKLADELLEYINNQHLANPVIMLPSGTGTTALFLQTYLPYKVLTCACVGGDSYLETQFAELESDKSLWPTILSTEKKYHFGKLYLEFYQIWRQLLKQTDIEFDLLYDPLGWITLLNYLDKQQGQEDIIYIHQGGLVGNESMLPRYQRKYESR
ncbi:1-aminocyclopropane-1-carboxylate deaminase/D-cysteine desulfhydrase [Psychromonas ossibalaenae]|uniref:1-aminocyclopropane-1-carboxylate deaminase/D-cysteine desulfhydrase n=1 Tax=Psychromonas ossibalaenae TaxID=444922 RepID=UPI0012FCC984|nr:1-aminocyclopropane-1-carboxylate deaminase/D-cysteine desulfhydrase [Psychromonas ossibalaenae]